MRRDRPSRPWHLYVLGGIAVVVAVLAVLEIGPPGSSARTSRETVTAQDGVVQSTVTGTGNVAAGADVDVNFKTSGTLQNLYVSAGQHVTEGQLLATLDPTSAELSLEQAQESLTAAEDQLTAAENGTASGSSSAQAQDPSSGSSSDTSYTGGSGTPEYVSDTTRKPGGGEGGTGGSKPSSSGTTTTITTITTISSGAGSKAPSSTRTTPTSSSRGSGSGSSGSGSSSASSAATHTNTTTTPSPSSIASAQAAVYGAEVSVGNAEQAVANTKLYAPINGTIASLSSALPGDSVSAGTTADASSSSSSSSSSSTGATGASTAAGGLGSSGSSSSSTGSGSSSSSPFAEIVNTGSLTMTVAFSESDITKIKVGQPATVTLDALPGVELAAHVAQISNVGSSSSGVVSYNTTIDLDQTNSQVRPGMSASAAVIVGQAQGVTVPNAAVTGTGSLGTVNLLQNGKSVSTQVVVGLRGDSRTQIISGLSAGQQLVITITLPSLSSSTSTTGSSGTLGGTSAFGGAGGGLLGGGGGGGGGAFFRRAFGGGG